MSYNVCAVIGGGLAGVEAAWGLAQRGFHVELYEAKGAWRSPAHQLDGLAELVCSNSLKSTQDGHAAALLKDEMMALGSLVLSAAHQSSVPAGKVMAVDREIFSHAITKQISEHPRITLVRRQVIDLIPHERGANGWDVVSEDASGTHTNSFKQVIVATGPLTAPALSERLTALTGDEKLYFYDSIAPVIETDSIDMSVAFKGSRYDVGVNPEGDYINCPMDAEQYYALMEAITSAEMIPVKEFDRLHCFEGCQPIEVMVATGKDTLRHGPMKPMGIRHPATGLMPYAVCQLRQDDTHATLFNMVGCQTRMKYGEQDRVFRMIPGLEKAEFARYGSMHRNTYVNGPKVLADDLSVKGYHGLYMAGQLVGVEGYVESAAMGIYVAHRMVSSSITIPRTTAIGALLHHVAHGNPDRYVPMNSIWGIFPPPQEKMRKPERIAWLLARARNDFAQWRGSEVRPAAPAMEGV